ncbi:MAG TPA: BON domain-containing protein [Burkholderiales bacterium]
MKLLILGVAIGFLAYRYSNSRRHGASVPDDELITKARLKLNELLEHPGSVNISVIDGHVTLSGPVAEPELRKVMRALRRMPGVRRLESRLTPHVMAA